ncbi:MAG: hypothetical protein R2685_07880 [Candidatus Nitrosocosmicus sp.]|nr:hypothetical protein [Candidatus Nitrosocosmicus sp.]
MANFLNLGKYVDSGVWNNLSSSIQSKQHRMYAFGKVYGEVERIRNILKSPVVYAFTGPKDQIDERTGKRVKARSLYAGVNAKSSIPDYEYPVANIDKLAKSREVLAVGESASSTEIDKALHDPYYPEFQEPLKYYNDMLLDTESASSLHTSQDFPLLNNTAVTGEVIIDQQTQFPLLDLVSVENTTDLIFRQYKGTGFDIEALVGEGGETEPKKMSFTESKWYTRKSGGEIQWTDEHEMQPYFIDPLQIARGQFSIAANKVKSQKVVKALAGLQTQAGADLTLYTNDHSTNNPYTYIALVRKFINHTNYGNMNVAACNSKTLYAILNNTNVKGLNATQGLTGEQGNKFTIPGVPGVTGTIDESLTDGYLYLLDSQRALKRIQGVIRTEQYRIARSGGNGLVYRDWNDVQVRDNNKAKIITTLLG